MSSNITADGKLVTPTLSGLRLQNTLMLNRPMQYPNNSTINEHLNIGNTNLPSSEQRPVIKYLAIGNGGHHISTAGGPVLTPRPRRHSATDAAPYNIIPFVLRPVENDLSDLERAAYALRREEMHNERRYWAYYLKRLDLSGVTPEDYLVQVSDGESTTSSFEYSEINLNPQPPTVPDYTFDVTETIQSDDGDYVSTSAEVPLLFSTWEINELMNVAQVLYSDPTAAVISEYAICSGVDTVATGENHMGSPFEYQEAIGVQVSTFLTTFENASFSNEAIGQLLVFGQSIPMLLAPGQVASVSNTDDQTVL